MRIECDEYWKDDFGDREFMGRHYYDEKQCVRVVLHGGAVVSDGVFVETKEEVAKLFRS